MITPQLKQIDWTEYNNAVENIKCAKDAESREYWMNKAIEISNRVVKQAYTVERLRSTRREMKAILEK